MTTHELQKALLEYYEEHYAVAALLAESDVYPYLMQFKLHFGVCHALKRVFNFNGETAWAYEAMINGPLSIYWDYPPSQYQSKEVNLSRLRTRITILKQLVNAQS